MGRGAHPTLRHDASRLTEKDVARAASAGEALGFRAAVLFVKGDWSEYQHTLGFPGCGDGKAPCPLCLCT